ncbi:hypothetical protein BLNAU_7740 [Blattamonas nauphoetae]|uniref:Uncharacterized protein n=1 Tax=Blattamonas nauphoetae TaxID=2049346 RepID=A0ABQ9Y0U3_9EUKA|nr:hypothetical protein BLNAU_7740 [Blattamonas nauphoetae]
MTVLSLPTSLGAVCFLFKNSNTPISKTDEALEFQIKNSVGLNRSGDLCFNTPSSRSDTPRQSQQNEGDCVRMEVDLDSTPRTLLFFVNGEGGECYVSGIPSSVRIGMELERRSELTTFLASADQHQSQRGRENSDGEVSEMRAGWRNDIPHRKGSVSVCQNNAVILEHAMTPNAWNPLACEQRSPPTDAELDPFQSEQVFSIVH